MFTASDISVPLGTVWGFVALQYHTLILNRVYVVCIGPRSVLGLVGGGLVASPRVVLQPMFDPLHWVGREKLFKYAQMQFADEAILSGAGANFRLPLSQIESVTYTDEKKWGMGGVPYSGRISVLASGNSREFILLGKEDGVAVRDRLQAACRAA